MEKLIKEGLFGAGLLVCDTEEMVGRYNDCLNRLGLDSTHLREFHVDGMGWSPEIAEEKDNSHYLSHGPENPLGIIISVNQRDCPIYMPAHSFDRVMLKAYFDCNNTAISNLTMSTGIGLDLDQRMGWYETLDDIACVDSVSVSSLTGGVSQLAREQQSLLDLFLDPEIDHWMDDDLRNQIVESVNKHGMLAGKALTIPEFEFTQFDDLYTVGLGGVYVFRHEGELALIVVEDEDQKKNASKELKSKIASLSDKGLLDRLLEEEIVGIDLDWYTNNFWAVEDRLEVLMISQLLKFDPEFDPIGKTQPQLRKAFRALPKEETKLYREIEKLFVRLKKGEEPPKISDEAKLFLLHPIRTSSKYEENLVWRLICQMQDSLIRVMRLYAVDKNLFLEGYESWSPTTQEWVVEYISGKYDSKQTYDN